jgi:glutamate/tyrosine decarboxylase-like PLP-dependent enzyme
VNKERLNMTTFPALSRASDYGQSFRNEVRSLHPIATAEELRQRFCIPLSEEPSPGEVVIDKLIAAAEPGLVGNTDPCFHAWVMGGSDPVGVAADWLTSIWGQNAAIFQTSPAAAIAEEAVSEWLLDMLDLPSECSVGFVTGATMAGFVALAAARSSVLTRYGHNFEKDGLQGAPFVRIYVSDDTHVSNFAALRHLGFGDANIVQVQSDANGLMICEELSKIIGETEGPKIIISTAGHINSGGFEDFKALAELAKTHGAWLHVDGAFGLWARAIPEKQHLTDGLDLADSWSIDGHKWLQIPYDSGFAIVKDAKAHKRVMDISASYLNQSENDGRNPTEFNPELSRRARGFAAWAVFQSLGRRGIRDLIAGHCNSAKALVDLISNIPGLQVVGSVELNQIILTASRNWGETDCTVTFLADELNNKHNVFVRTAEWKGRTVLRLSIITKGTDLQQVKILAKSIKTAWADVNAQSIKA